MAQSTRHLSTHRHDALRRLIRCRYYGDVFINFRLLTRTYRSIKREYFNAIFANRWALRLRTKGACVRAGRIMRGEIKNNERRVDAFACRLPGLHELKIDFFFFFWKRCWEILIFFLGSLVYSHDAFNSVFRGIYISVCVAILPALIEFKIGRRDFVCIGIYLFLSCVKMLEWYSWNVTINTYPSIVKKNTF